METSNEYIFINKEASRHQLCLVKKKGFLCEELVVHEYMFFPLLDGQRAGGKPARI